MSPPFNIFLLFCVVHFLNLALLHSFPSPPFIAVTSAALMLRCEAPVLSLPRGRGPPKPLSADMIRSGLISLYNWFGIAVGGQMPGPLAGTVPG